MVFETRSMEPTIPYHGRVIVDLLAYQREGPKRFDLVLFEVQEKRGANVEQIEPEGTLVGLRVVGLPGEEVQIMENGVLINGTRLELPGGLVCTPAPSSEYFRRFNSVTLSRDGYYVIGDNTRFALDSRYWGALPRAWIRGRIECPQPTGRPLAQ